MLLYVDCPLKRQEAFVLNWHKVSNLLSFEGETHGHRPEHSSDTGPCGPVSPKGGYFNAPGISAGT
jgi:hypothetical protein